ncbi:MAG: ferritin-like domain-containing protein [Burkholderiales bacterium]|nr:ferritin-like domain-containing protein [Burkholderiales bacterium]
MLTIDIEDLGFDSGAHLLVKHALGKIPEGSQILVKGSSAEWAGQLRAWCRMTGHSFAVADEGMLVTKSAGNASAIFSGRSDPGSPDAVLDRPPACLGLAARGAQVEAGSPEFDFRLKEKIEVWSENAADLYAQSVAAQWDPGKSIDWNIAFDLPDEIEDAVSQVMTYLIENENAALVVPARFLGTLHPHFREVQAVLAMQIADEARHIEVFTTRLRMKGREPALSSAGGQASLKTLLDESDFSVAGFLLSVLGEGTFVSLLHFLHEHAPDPVTRQIAKLAARDEARHVAFGMGHLLARLESEPEFRHRLAIAVGERHDVLSTTSGLNTEVFDALILLAAGSLEPAAIASGFAKVQELMRDMHAGRYARLLRLGFGPEEAGRLASLHTRNFM